MSTTYRYLQGLLQYVLDEISKITMIEENSGDDLLFDKTEWTMNAHPPEDVPQQNNDYDCGVYICIFAEFITFNLPLHFEQKHIDMCRNRIAMGILSSTNQN